MKRKQGMLGYKRTRTSYLYIKNNQNLGCAPPNNATADDEVYIFSTSPKDGIYESGTEVTLYCMNGSVVSG